MAKNWNEEEVLAEIVSGNHFTRNPANSYTNLTYNFRLFCMPPKDFLIEVGDGETAPADIHDFFSRLDSYKQVIIADTAVTGYNITDVEMSSVFSDPTSRASTTTEITMKVVEPNGVSFLDALQQAATEAGVKNYTDFYYYLELTFKGYDRLGKPNLAPFDGLENGGRWLWAVKLNTIDVNLTTGGGQYTLNMISFDRDVLRYDGAYGSVIDTLLVRGETIGDFLDELATKLNASWKERLYDDVITHKFECHGMPTPQGTDSTIPKMTPETVRGMHLRPKEEDWNSVRSTSLNFGIPTTDKDGVKEAVTGPTVGTSQQPNLPTAHIPRGTTIPEIISMLMSSCETAQDLAKDSHAENFGPDQSNTTVNAKSFRESVTWHIIPEVRLKSKFHYLSSKYFREIIWHVYPRYSQLPILSQTQIDQAKDPNVQKGMIAALAARGFLPKRYNYLFTGMNTEVLSFDLNFNLAWSVALPHFRDYYTEQPLDHAKYNQDSIDSWGNVLDRNAIAQANKDKAHQNFIDQKAQTLAAAHSGATPDKNKENLAALKAARDASIAAQNKAKTTLTDVQTAEQQAEAANPTPPIEQEYSRRYIEDILDNFSGTDDATSSIASRFPPIPINYASADESKQAVGIGMPSQYHAGKTIYGAVLNQIYGTMTTQMQAIDISVRGDPFWLGRGSFEEALNHKKEIVDGSQMMNVLNGTTCILLQFKYPNSVDDSGRIELSANETVSGIYTVTSVKTTFNNGSVNHVLHGVRKPLFNLAMSALGVEPDPVTTPETPPKPAPKPVTPVAAPATTPLPQSYVIGSRSTLP